MTSMPKINGSNSLHEREPMKPFGVFASRKALADPETRNNKESRHGLLSNMRGSMVSLACGLFTCQPQLT